MRIILTTDNIRHREGREETVQDDAATLFKALSCIDHQAHWSQRRVVRRLQSIAQTAYERGQAEVEIGSNDARWLLAFVSDPWSYIRDDENVRHWFGQMSTVATLLSVEDQLTAADEPAASPAASPPATERAGVAADSTGGGDEPPYTHDTREA